MSDIVLKLNLDNLSVSEDNDTNSIDSKIQSNLNIKFCVSPEQRRIHYLYQEFAAIAKDPIEGIYVSPSEHNILKWFGVLIVRAGIYCGGMFRFSLIIPDDFPDTKTMPIVKFDESIFHPLIYTKTNITDLSRYFPSGWQRDRNHIYQVLVAIQGMFFRCDIDASLAANPEAAILIGQDRHKFKQLAREAVRRSRTQIYEIVNTDDANAINFTPWNDAEMEPFRKYLIGKINLDELCSFVPRSTSPCVQSLVDNSSSKKEGFSWVNAEHCLYMCDLFPEIKSISELKKVKENYSNDESPISTDINEAFDHPLSFTADLTDDE